MDGIPVLIAHSSWVDKDTKSGQLVVDGKESDRITVTWVENKNEWKRSSS